MRSVASTSDVSKQQPVYYNRATPVNRIMNEQLHETSLLSPSGSANEHGDVFEHGQQQQQLTNGHLAPPNRFERSPLRSSLVKDTSRRCSPARKTVSFSSLPQEKKVSNVADCLQHMTKGADLTKVRTHTRQYRRRFTLDADFSHVRWTPTNKKPHKAKISIDMIKEIRVGRNTDVLRSMETFFADTQDECAFSIIYGDNYECIDLVANAADEANIWVTGLMALTSGHKECLEASSSADPVASNATLRERWLTKSFEDTDTDSAEALTEKQIIYLVRQLNERVPVSRIKHKIKELDCGKAEDQRGLIRCSEFVELYKDLATRPEVYFLMVRYANKDYLTWEDLHLFLETEQGIVNCSQQHTEKIISTYEASDEGRTKGYMTVDGFTNYLLSPSCQLFDPTQSEIVHDMTRPLCDYFIASSNNTYLVEDQLKGPSSVNGYICALKRGCRLIELDVWEDEQSHEPMVYNGHTPAVRLTLSKALHVINEYAFETSCYPLFLKLEQHLSVGLQLVLAASLKTVFGHKLYIPKDNPPIIPRPDGEGIVFPSPDELRDKILIMGKYSDDFDGAGEVELTDDDESHEAQRRPSRRQPLRRVAVCKQLAELTCPFLVSTTIHDAATSLNFSNDRFGHCVSMNESLGLKLAHTHGDDFAQLTRTSLTRVYPNHVRVDSSNMNPQEFWNFGIQCVALNYQTPGLMMDLQEGKFLANGGCGYVLKPPVMREPLETLGPAATARSLTPVNATPQILHIKIISGQNLPRPRGSTAKGDSADPFCVIEIFGVPLDCAEERTKTVRNDNYNPSFDESFQFQISVPELALVRLLVLDDDFIGDDFIGQYTIPFECLQSGYRHLTLLNNEGEPMENVTLFVHAAITNRRGGGKARKRGMSVKRKQQRIHTGVKMIGLKPLDDLFKGAVIPLAECIQLRNQLEAAMTEWQDACGLGPTGTMRQGLRLLHSRVLTAALGHSPPNSPTTRTSTDSNEMRSSTSGLELSESAPSMYIYLDSDKTPHVEFTGQLPEQLQKTFSALENLLTRCNTVMERTDQLLQKLEEATRRIAESYEELSQMCIEAGLRGQKAQRATENFAWNLRLLKAQLDLMYRTQQEAKHTMQQVSDTGCVLGILQTKCAQPCEHQTAPLAREQ